MAAISRPVVIRASHLNPLSFVILSSYDYTRYVRVLTIVTGAV